MNISRLLTKSKSKTKFIFDLCTPNTLFLCFCETFLTDEISDNELLIPDFTITIDVIADRGWVVESVCM